MRLGLDLHVPHRCQCGSGVDAGDPRSIVCKKAQSTW